MLKTRGEGLTAFRPAKKETMARALKLDKAGKLKLSEADVVQQVTDFASAHGWRVFATGYGEIRKGERVVATVGEEYMPDRLFIRYKTGSYAEVLWIEFKRPKSAGDSGGKLSKGQRKWIAEERLIGATCWVIDSLVEFCDLYRREFGNR